MMSHAVTEFIYLTFKQDVKPEDPSNDGGRVFIDAQKAATQQSGYKLSSWGRTIEDENNVVWVIEWKDDTGSVALSSLDTILEPGSTPISFHATLMPAMSQYLCKYSSRSCCESGELSPPIELAILAFPDNIEPSDKRVLDTDLINFRSALLDLQESKAPSSFSMGWVERPCTVKHPDSESGHASLAMFAIGWRSIEEHEAARNTKVFAEVIAPLRKWMLPAVKVLEMRHVRFRCRQHNSK